MKETKNLNKKYNDPCSYLETKATAKLFKILKSLVAFCGCLPTEKYVGMYYLPTEIRQ